MPNEHCATASLMCITAWLHTFAQFFYIYLNLCIARQYLSAYSGALCFCLSPVDNAMHIKCIFGIVMVFVAT